MACGFARPVRRPRRGRGDRPRSPCALRRGSRGQIFGSYCVVSFGFLSRSQTSWVSVGGRCGNDLMTSKVLGARCPHDVDVHRRVVGLAVDRVEAAARRRT